MNPDFAWIILPAAVALDLILGDPSVMPHPIYWMGNAITFFEPRFRRLSLPPVVSGTLFASSLVLLTWLAGYLILKVAGAIHPGVALAVEILLIYYCLAIRSLDCEARAVAKALSVSLDAARTRVSRIVGREVHKLDETGVSRAAVETVAENLVDGIISPIFYAVLGGAPLCLAFKMISTLDSMVGYKNDAYIDFGKAAARLDDLANFLPARLSVPVIAAAARLLSGNGREALQTGIREGKNHSSPNAGYPEAAFAGALNVRLGGSNYYHGILVEKPYLGGRFGDAGIGHISKACDLMMVVSLLWAGLFCGLDALLRYLGG
jgi:adenosylcobinamide-phosphate synthase